MQSSYKLYSHHTNFVHCFVLKISLIRKFVLILFIVVRVVATMLLITYRHFFTRATKDVGISNLTGKRVKIVKGSAVSDHLLQCDCTIDFDHFDILASDSNNFRLLIK